MQESSIEKDAYSGDLRKSAVEKNGYRAAREGALKIKEWL